MRSFFYSVKNLIRWFPIIWHDRQWDHNYLLAIIEKKLSFMIDYHQKHNIFVGCEREIRYMTICRFLVNRIMNDDYIMSKEFDRLYNINKRAAYNHARCIEAQDMDMLFKLLRKHLKKWWD